MMIRLTPIEEKRAERVRKALGEKSVTDAVRTLLLDAEASIESGVALLKENAMGRAPEPKRRGSK